MNNFAIEEMLSELIENIDYDIWKEMFLQNELPEEVNYWIIIVKKHMREWDNV